MKTYQSHETIYRVVEQSAFDELLDNDGFILIYLHFVIIVVLY